LSGIERTGSVDGIPEPPGPFNWTVGWNGLVFVSGVRGIDPDTGQPAVGDERRLELIFQHLEKILDDAGSSLQSVLVSTVYVQATSANQIDAVQAEIEDSVAGATVSSQSDLASTVSSSLASASSLITNLGTWLSILVLAVALALAVLFTISGVTRRTREFGTLKAIGWSNGRVVGQVAGESVIQGLIGGAIGLAVGLAGIWIINLISPTISSTAASTGQAGPGQGGGPMGGGFGGMAQQAADIVLHAPITLWVVAAAVGIAIAGGLIAGAFGGWRAARLSPAEALRSVG